MRDMQNSNSFPDWHGTTILAVRKNGQTVIAGDGQVSMGPTVVKGNARKVRRLAGGKVLAGFIVTIIAARKDLDFGAS